jgi:glycerol uptake facilitator-like aquaporin
MHSAGQRVGAEFFGTAFLLAIVVGSGIMAQRLSAGNDGLALLANSIATGGGLYALITTLLPVSGAHFNPVVTALAWWRRNLTTGLALAYCAAQICGAVAGVMSAHVMFGLDLVQASATDRTGWPLAFAEFVATLGLLSLISLAPRERVAAAVAGYITAAYWFTASTSFANPAVTLARALTASFAGINWAAVPSFVAAQLAALLAVAILVRAFSSDRNAGPLSSRSQSGSSTL